MNRRRTRHRRKTSHPRRFRGIKRAILLVVFVAMYFGARISMHWNAVNSEDTARVSFEIEAGQPFVTIVDNLVANNLVRDGFVFRLYARHKGLDNKLQAGSYILQRNLNYDELLEILQNGKSEEMKLTIPEGYTIEQIDDLLVKMNLIDEDVFVECARSCDLGIGLDSLEGYLFPSTYYVNPKNFSAAGFLKRLYQTFEAQTKDLVAGSERTIDEIVKVASMVEREASTDAEMPVIAGIIWKRYDEKMHLGIDATTRYEKNDWKGPLYKADFETKSPYNTRLTLGLPPTAISNAGFAALEATVNPEETEYYYYLHDDQGRIHYGKTLEEHNQNKLDHL